MKRSDFLNRFLVLIGVSSSNILLDSCSVEGEEEGNEEVEFLSEEDILYQELKDKTSETGNFLEGKLFYVDITNDNYLKTISKPSQRVETIRPQRGITLQTFSISSFKFWQTIASALPIRVNREQGGVITTVAP